MCGLVGYYSKNKKVSRYHLEQALQSIRHRGPDESNIWQSNDGHIALAHNRLKIIAPNNGSQPIFSKDRTICAIVNGEFYDYKIISNSLRQEGFVLHTESDSEILVPLYQRYGIDCLKHLNGEFSFILWDSRNQLLFAARDRCGAKPIFYLQTEEEIILASEIKAILQFDILTEWNHQAFMKFNFGIPDQEETLFKNINSIKPGHYLIAKVGSLTIAPYWEFKPKETSHLNYKLAANELYTLLEKSVLRRLTADTEVGCYLSGGIDSASILAIAAKHQPNIKAFTISFDDKNYDEAPYARLVAEYLNVDLSIIQVTQQNLADNYKKAVYYRESLIYQTSGIAKFLLSRHVKNQGIKSVITGEGGDEVLVGYPSFKEDYLSYCLGQGKSDLLFKKLVQENINASSAYVSGEVFSELSSICKLFHYTPSFLKLSCEISRTASRLLLPNALYDRNYYEEFTSTLQLPLKWEASPVGMSQYLWSKTFFPELILSYLGDRMEMAHSVEGRLPFLDIELIEFVNNLPMQFKINDRLIEKCILRDAMEKHLPDKVRLRTKHIFSAPPTSNNKFQDSIYNLMREVFTDRSFRKMGIYDVKNLEKLLNSLSSINDREKMIAEFTLNLALSTYFLKECYKI